MMLPKPLAQRLKNSMAILFTQRWLETPDDLGDFPTNADRFVAEELWRMRELKPPAFRGFALQGLAASWHFMGPERLKTIGETVQNVLVCTGNSDAMIGHQHSDVLVAGIRAGGCNVQVRVFEGVGHTLLWEAMDDYNKMVEEFTETSQQMSR